MHFTAFDLWVNNLRTKMKKREKSSVDVRAVCTVYMERGMQ